MKTIVENKIVEIEIKKSKFIAYTFKLASENDVDELLEMLKKRHKDATHITYAFVLNSPVMEKCSDDGEPSGTAGKPILDVIKKQELTNILVVVVRYFGGIKLGAGGLVRAYSNSAKSAIDESGMTELNRYNIFQIKVLVDNKFLVDNDKSIKVIDIDYSDIGNKIVRYMVAIMDTEDNIKKINSISKEMFLIEKVMM